MQGDHIKYRKGYKYQLAETYRVYAGIFPQERIETEWLALDTDGVLTIKCGYAWDGASGPTIDTPDSMRGSLVHDALYQLMRLGKLSEDYRKQADQLLHDICVEDGMAGFRADIWRYMVNDLAGFAAKKGAEQPVLIAP